MILGLETLKNEYIIKNKIAKILAGNEKYGNAWHAIATIKDKNVWRIKDNLLFFLESKRRCFNIKKQLKYVKKTLKNVVVIFFLLKTIFYNEI